MSRTINSMLEDELFRKKWPFKVIGDFKPLEHVLGSKPYQSRADYKILYTDLELDLTVIHFGPNQGTGNTIDYSSLIDIDGNIVPSYATPRDKPDKMIKEYMVPFLDLNQEPGKEGGRTSLTLATLIEDDVVDYEFRQRFGHKRGTMVRTMYTDEDIIRHRDPHAIFNETPYDQVAGFFSLSSEHLKKI